MPSSIPLQSFARLLFIHIGPFRAFCIYMYIEIFVCSANISDVNWELAIAFSTHKRMKNVSTYLVTRYQGIAPTAWQNSALINPEYSMMSKYWPMDSNGLLGINCWMFELGTITARITYSRSTLSWRQASANLWGSVQVVKLHLWTGPCHLPGDEYAWRCHVFKS